MLIPYHCDGCGYDGTADEAYAGRRARCPRCQTVLEIPAAASEPDFTPTPQHPVELSFAPHQPPRVVDVADEQQWRAAMLKAMHRTALDTQETKRYTGCLLAAVVGLAVLGLLAGLLAGPGL